MKAERRNFGLDVVRATAVSSVLLSHVSLETAAHAPIALTTLIYLGAAGVELFFSLSGFLIGGLLLDLAQGGLRPPALGSFWFRRWMRTLPLYYVALAGVGWWLGLADPHAWLFVQNFYPNERRLLPPAWSLVLEEYFYLFFPLAMLLLSPLVRRPVRLVASVAGTLIVGCIAARTLNAAGVLHYPWDYVHTHPLLRLDCAAYGVLAACLHRSYRPRVEALLATWGGVLLLACGALTVFWCGLFVVVVTHPALATRAGFAWWGLPWFVVQDSFLEIVFAAAILALAIRRKRSPERSALAWSIRQCSLLSYSMYLVHMFAMVMVEVRFPHLAGPVKAATQLAATMAIALVTYFGVERPFLMLRDHVSRRRGRVVA